MHGVTQEELITDKRNLFKILRHAFVTSDTPMMALVPVEPLAPTAPEAQIQRAKRNTHFPIVIVKQAVKMNISDLRKFPSFDIMRHKFRNCLTLSDETFVTLTRLLGDSASKKLIYFQRIVPRTRFCDFEGNLLIAPTSKDMKVDVYNGRLSALSNPLTSKHVAERYLKTKSDRKKELARQTQNP
jgi:hypothetical protein